jgi:hypothetical protein
VFDKVPLVHDVAEALAPDTILEPEGGLEKTCGLIFLGNILVLLSYACKQPDLKTL